MPTIQAQSPSQPASSKASPVEQNPVPPGFPPSTPDATQTIFLNHPLARLSSSPASSPRIVDPPPTRRGSVHPAMSETMEGGKEPGADFFDDGSSDSEWEDSEGDVTQTISGFDGRGLRSTVHGIDQDNESTPRGRSMERSELTVFPYFHDLPVHDSGLGTDEHADDERISSPMNIRGTKRARKMSLQRLGRDNLRVVHHRSSSGTPRVSLRSNDSDAASLFTDRPKPFPHDIRTGEGPAGISRSNSFHGHHRRNTSESLIADSIINAHVMTMRALEALNISPSRSIPHSQGPAYSYSAATTSFPKFSSFTNDRRVRLMPLSTADHDRPAHLPSHFIKTPYPFTAKKEFPRPKTRPRQLGGSGGRFGDELTRLDSGYDDEFRINYDSRKGKHVLGLVASEGEYDLRNRLERNEEAQGIIRSRTDSGREGVESVVWLSLQRQTWRRVANDDARKLAKTIVPSNLATSSPDRTGKKTNSDGQIEFDDKVFAERLRAGHRELAGSWLRRTFSARKLRHIQLGQAGMWSGSPLQDRGERALGLLSIGRGVVLDADARSPFTEDGLMKLYRRPGTGKARYTWVHWARRVAALHDPTQAAISSRHPPMRSFRRRARSLDTPSEKSDSRVFSPYLDEPSSSTAPPNTITTIQFVHSLSTTRILVALALMLVLSVLAALLWIFLRAAETGVSTGLNMQWSGRVGSGMAIGIFMLLLEGLGFGAWVWLS